MRRWLKYGVVRVNGLPALLYARDVNRGGFGAPYWITQLKHETLRTCLNTYFQATQTNSAYILPMIGGANTPPPAADCQAQHIFPGFVIPNGASRFPQRIGDALIAGFVLGDGSVGPRIFDDSSSYGPLDKDYNG